MLNFRNTVALQFFRQGQLLANLPPTLGFRGSLGRPDPYEWDRPPGSSVYFPLGDGLPRERPQLSITGTHLYHTDDEAMQDAAEIHRACRLADQVMFRGRHLCSLRPDLPGICEAAHGERYREVTYTLTLNPTKPITPEDIQEAQQT